MGTSYSPNIVKDGLVFYVDAANPRSYISGSSDTFNLINKNITGSLINDTNYQSVGGGSWYLDNVDDSINCGNHSIFNFGDGSSDSPFSISTWVRPTDTTNFTPIAKDTSGNREWTVRWVGDKLHFYTIDNSAGGYIGRKYNTDVTAYQLTWMHTAYTYDGSGGNSGFKIYLNGVRVDDTDYTGGSYTAMEVTTQPVQIGAQGAYIDSSYGYISNMKIYNKELTAQEVKQNYNALKRRFI